jgi:hypothetical protein
MHHYMCVRANRDNDYDKGPTSKYKIGLVKSFAISSVLKKIRHCKRDHIQLNPTSI